MKEGKPSSRKTAQKTSKPASRGSAKSPGRGTGKASAAKAAYRESGSTPKKETTGSTTPSASRTPVVDQQPALPVTHGKVGIFGGPRDRGIKPDDKLALPTGPHGVYERIRSLNPKSFYCSMRWNYHVQHMSPEEVKRWWANKKLLVSSTKSGSAVVVRAVDYGPHENTGLDISVSPGAAEALAVEIGDEVDIALADPKSSLGPTE